MTTPILNKIGKYIEATGATLEEAVINLKEIAT